MSAGQVVIWAAWLAVVPVGILTGQWLLALALIPVGGVIGWNLLSDAEKDAYR